MVTCSPESKMHPTQGIYDDEGGIGIKLLNIAQQSHVDVKFVCCRLWIAKTEAMKLL